MSWLRDTAAVPRMFLLGIMGLLVADVSFVPAALRGAGVLVAVVFVPWSLVDRMRHKVDR